MPVSSYTPRGSEAGAAYTRGRGGATLWDRPCTTNTGTGARVTLPERLLAADDGDLHAFICCWESGVALPALLATFDLTYLQEIISSGAPATQSAKGSNKENTQFATTKCNKESHKQSSRRCPKCWEASSRERSPSGCRARDRTRHWTEPGRLNQRTKIIKTHNSPLGPTKQATCPSPCNNVHPTEPVKPCLSYLLWRDMNKVSPYTKVEN